MSKSKPMLVAIGLAIILITPVTTSSAMIVDTPMEKETELNNRTNELKIKQEMEFISSHAEFIPEDIETVEIDEKEYIGKFTITHYCSCDDCNYPYGGYPAANGEEMIVGYTVAVDPNIISLDTIIEIDGYGIRKAQDTGGRIKKNKIDMLVSNHKEAYSLGVKKDVDVWIIKE